jgi:hypothetical protein
MNSGFLVAIQIFTIFFFAFWIGGCLFIAIAPYTFWKIFSSWKATREPSKAYFVFNRIGGIIFAAIGISFWIFVWTRK